MFEPARPLCILAVIALMSIALAMAGCSNPVAGPTPSVTVVVPYVPPSPTPIPTETPTSTPQTSWNGLYVKLYGNVSAKGGDHVYGTVKIYYLDENYWDDHPTTEYDTGQGGAYSLDVRSGVPFIPEFGYYYFGRLPMEMFTKRLDRMTLVNDTKLDYNVMTSNITPVK